MMLELIRNGSSCVISLKSPESMSVQVTREGGSMQTLWAVRTADEASDSSGDMGMGVRFMMALKRL